MIQAGSQDTMISPSNETLNPKTIQSDFYGCLIPIGNAISRKTFKATKISAGEDFVAKMTSANQIRLPMPKVNIQESFKSRFVKYLPDFSLLSAPSDDDDIPSVYQITMKVREDIPFFCKSLPWWPWQSVNKKLNYHITCIDHANVRVTACPIVNYIHSNNELVLLWIPKSYTEEGVPSSGIWVEVSEFGSIHKLRTTRKVRGVQLSGLSNRLLDHSVIYSNNICIQWRSYLEKEMDLNDQIPMEIICPITLDPISSFHIKNEPKSNTTKWNRHPTEYETDRPYFFSGCGHVFSAFHLQQSSNSRRVFERCCTCRTPGHLVPLISTPTCTIFPSFQDMHAFNTCGHMVKASESELWTTVLKMPDSETWLDMNLAHRCPVCFGPVECARKLYLTTK